MATKITWGRLRTLLVTGLTTGVLAACAGPSVQDRTAYLDSHYGKTCAANTQASSGRKYDECVANAYKTDHQRAVSKYNADTDHAGMAVLLLIH